MPLFQVRGPMDPAMVAALANGRVTASAPRQVLADLAADLGGTLVAAYVVAGDWRLMALLEVPIDGAMRMMPRLQASGVFAAGQLRLAITIDAAELDATIREAAAIGMPWGRAAG